MSCKFFSIKKRIVLLLKSNWSFGAVTGIHYAIIGQGKQFFADVTDQQIVISPRQICAPYAPPEQYITTHQYIIRLLIKTKMRRRMARRKDEFQFGIAERYATRI